MISVRTDFEKLWELITSFSRTWKVLEKRSFSVWLWKSFEVLLENILKYLRMDITEYHIERVLCCVC